MFKYLVASFYRNRFIKLWPGKPLGFKTDIMCHLLCRCHCLCGASKIWGCCKMVWWGISCILFLLFNTYKLLFLWQHAQVSHLIEPVRRPSLWALWHHRSPWSLWEGLHYEPFGTTEALGACEKAFILSPLASQELLEPLRRPSFWALWNHRSSWSLWEGLHHEPFGTTEALGACEKAFTMSPLAPQELLEPVRRPSSWALWYHRSSWSLWEGLHDEPSGWHKFNTYFLWSLDSSRFLVNGFFT